jgi:DNA-binding NtrC family response regulator
VTEDKSVPLREGTTTVVDKSRSPGCSGVLIRVHDVSASPSQRTLTNGALVIGAGLGADIIINDESVSRRHLQLALTNDEIEILDLGSRNGTFYQGQRVGRLTLNREATITLGRVRVSVSPQLNSVSQIDADVIQYGSVIGNSQPMQQLFSTLKELENSTVPVVIQGESGTGRELLARTIHEHSPVRQGPFVVVNCGAIDRNSARSELLGTGMGASPGGRAGAFEAAAGGTLLLDEIGELSPDIQPLLLQILESEKVVRIGETLEQSVSVRVIASTSLSLTQAVSEGRFRSDLLYRLNVVVLHVPPLRTRDKDVGILARHFASQCGIVRLPVPVVEQLEQHKWPGNVRELLNIIRGFAAIGELPQAPIQGDEQLAEMLRRVLDVEQPYQVQKDHILNQFIDVYLSMLLERTHGNQSEAARVSGIDRAHLNKMIAKLRRESSRPSLSTSEAAHQAERQFPRNSPITIPRRSS